MYCNSPYHRPVDNGPGTQVERRDVVGRASEATRPTCELVPSGTVCLGDVPARRALATGVARVHNEHGHASEASLVFDESAKLCETPVVQPCPLALSGRNPVTDARQFLKGNASAGALRFLHYCFADTVVLVPLVAGLLPGDGLELPLGRLRSFLLKVLAAVLVLAAVVLYCLPAVGMPVTVAGQVDDPEINAEHPFGKERIRFVNVTDDSYVPLTAHVEQLHLSLPMLQHASLVLAAGVWHFLPSVDCPDGNPVVFQYAPYPVVVGLRGVLAEPSWFLGIASVRTDDFLDAQDGRLRCQPEVSFDVVVDFLLQSEHLEALVRPCLLTDPVASLVGPFERRQQTSCLLGCWQEFYGCNHLHNSSIDMMGVVVKRQRLSLQPPLGGGISARWGDLDGPVPMPSGTCGVFSPIKRWIAWADRKADSKTGGGRVSDGHTCACEYRREWLAVFEGADATTGEHVDGVFCAYTAHDDPLPPGNREVELSVPDGQTYTLRRLGEWQDRGIKRTVCCDACGARTEAARQRLEREETNGTQNNGTAGE